MILTVTLNTALDLTYRVAHLVPDTTHRVSYMRYRAGGKGVNVARVLAGLNRPVLATGLLGGPTGDTILAELRDAAVPAEFVPVAGDSRRTVAVHAGDGSTTLFNEPGPVITKTEWRRFQARYTELAATAEVVVLSGSLPPGVPVDGYATLINLAKAAGARTILDTSGPPLSAGLAAGPDLIKPNAAELHAATGITPPLAAAKALRGNALRGTATSAVIASIGPDGLLAVTADGHWRAAPPHPVTGNPTGAGDACVAALATALAQGKPDWPAALADAVALAGAAVAAPVAGDIDLPTYHWLRPAVLVEELAC